MLSVIGNKAIKTGELTKELTFGVGDPLDRFSIENGRKAIENKYKEKGYSQVEVTVDPDDLNAGKVTYVVREGPEIFIRNIRFEDNTHFGWLKLRMSISSQARFWPFVKGLLNAEDIDRDVDTLKQMYVDEGFLDAEVGRRLDFSADRSRVIVVFLINQGPRYRVNTVIFHGNTVFSSDELLKRLSMQSGRFFTTTGLDNDTKAVQDAYGEMGFIYATVKASRQFAPPGEGERLAAMVNVTYDIVENDQYRVGKIEIRGNNITQDRVIRRQLRFFPEQLFNTVAVEESRNRLMETRLFNNVTVTPQGQRRTCETPW